MKRLLAIPGLVAFVLVSTACDSVVAYTVRNNTSEDLTAWVLFDDCERVVGYRDDYDYERDVPAGETAEVSDVTGSLPRGEWCLQVVDSERRIVLSEPYDHLRGSAPDVVIREPITRGQTIPDESTLPTRSFTQSFWREFTIQPVTFIFSGLVLVGMLIGIGFAVRWAWRGANPRPPLN